jgi:superfamily II DNA or RNA helicase
MTLNFDWDNNKRQGIMSGDLFHEIREHFSVFNDAAKFARRRGYMIPSRTYVITPTGRFDVGLYDEIQQYIWDNQYQVTVTKTDEFKTAQATRSFLSEELPACDLKYKLRPYQEDAVKGCLQTGRGTTILATGGGKTLIMAAILQHIISSNPKFQCALIVPDLGLVEQTYNSFKEYGVKFTVSKWTGKSEINLSSNVIICNMGIIQSKNSNTEWIEYSDVVMVDEVHKLRRSNKINKLINKVHTCNRYGFTGTMPEDMLDQWNIIGKIGAIIFNQNSYDLRQKNFIANVKIQMLKMEYKDQPATTTSTNPTEAYRNEINFIIHNKYRNDILAKLCANFDNNALLMVDYLEHGEILHQHLSDNCKDKKVYYIRGEVEVTERERIRKLIEERNDVVVVAISKIFSTGIDIKNLHYIIFASGGKAKVKIIQSIGRGLRLHKDKKELIIFDIVDSLRYGLQHAAKREQFYKTESITYGTQTIKENR